jgi:hypothetical protein
MLAARLTRSYRAGKKWVAIFDDGQTVTRTHFGCAGCKDYTLYWSKDGPAVAKAKRKAYLARHGATQAWTDPTSAGTLARYVLWEKPTVAAAWRAYKKRFKLT